MVGSGNRLSKVKLEFRRFWEKDFEEYVSWSTGPELNRRLEPTDRDWLGAALSHECRTTWAVFGDEALVAVAETVFDPEAKPTAVSIAPRRLVATFLHKYHHPNYVSHYVPDNAPQTERVADQMIPAICWR